MSFKEIKMITRKIKFVKFVCTHAGWLIVTATRVASNHNGHILRYKLCSYTGTSSITFRCPESEWLKLHCEFLGETNGKIDYIGCNRV